MILRTTTRDIKLILYWVGRVILGVGMLMSIPLVISLVLREWNAALDFALAISACCAFWLVTENTCYERRDLGWMHGMIVVSLGWILAMLFGAIPHMLSGHFASYLDACFDLMSGYTTTGMTLIQDLDHLSHGMNMWRHLLTYAGGQGIVVIALTFLFSGGAGAFRVYVGEGREERLYPNVIRTARAIWMISLTYLVVGSFALYLALLGEGMPAGRGLLHSVWLFMESWATAGFNPQSLNILYYHSLSVELITMVIFTIGSFNFALHFAVWTGNRREVLRNVEIRSMACTLFIGAALFSLGLWRAGALRGTGIALRKGLYAVMSAHTTAGGSVFYPGKTISELGLVSAWALILMMMVGGSAASTAGGFKGLRVGIIFRSLWQDVRRVISPDYSVVSEKVRAAGDLWLDDQVVRSAMFVVICYMVLFIGGAVAGMFFSHEPTSAFFESVSLGSNTGLTAGITGPATPIALKLTYMIIMWMGRLEFIFAFALIARVYSLLGGRGRGGSGRKGR